ncbi:MAG: SGNH/GDSL hydrolase family protein [Usitatibacter sp.]
MVRAPMPRQPWCMWALYVILAILLTPAATLVAVYASRIRFSRGIVARTQPAQSSPEGCRKTIVVASDSTAFGVGALPGESTAGRIAAAFPHARVINVARSGANIGRVLDQLNSLEIEQADLVLIHACANDVLEFRSVAVVERDLRAALSRARQLSGNVILMPGHDFSVAPFFLRGLKWLILRHAVRIHAVVKRVTAETGVIFVDLFRDPGTEPFVREPRRYYCADGLHPSGEGYAIWFAALIAQAPLARFLAENGSD